MYLTIFVAFVNKEISSVNKRAMALLTSVDSAMKKSDKYSDVRLHSFPQSGGRVRET